jgi:membrane protein required for colicin V production
MNLLDLFILLPLAWGAWKGFRRGLVFEVLMLIGLVLGIYVAFKFSGLLHGLVASLFHAEGAVIPVISFVVVFLTIMLVTVLLARLLESVLKATALQPVNKVAGAAFGVLKYALIVSVILWLLKGLDPYWHFINKDTRRESVLYKPILNVSAFIRPALDDIREEFIEHVGEDETGE